MPVVEQKTIIKAPLRLVMEVLGAVEQIPAWATVTGAITNINGAGAGQTYNWRYQFNKFSFSGQSEVLEQTHTTLITQTTGDINSLWTITLSPAGVNRTSIWVLVEYTPPNPFIEVLTDIAHNPEVAGANLARFKAMVEARAGTLEEQLVTHA